LSWSFHRQPFLIKSREPNPTALIYRADAGRLLFNRLFLVVFGFVFAAFGPSFCHADHLPSVVFVVAWAATQHMAGG